MRNPASPRLSICGGTQYAFSDPASSGDGLAYDECAAGRSWEAPKRFLAEIFSEPHEEEGIGQDQKD